MGAVHPPDLVDVDPGHRLEVRHHGEGLQGRRGELVGFLPGQHTPDQIPPLGVGGQLPAILQAGQTDARVPGDIVGGQGPAGGLHRGPISLQSLTEAVGLHGLAQSKEDGLDGVL